MRILLVSIAIVICFGVKAQTIELLEVTSGTMQPFPSFGDKKLLVAVFYSHHCPYATRYEDRLTALQNEYNDNVEFVLINANNPRIWREEGELNMKSEARKRSFPFKYFADKDQLSVQMLDAKKTPHAYLLRPADNEKFEIIYQGAIDDNPQSATAVHKDFLKDAIENALNGSSSENSIPIGCRIKS